jgi:hypothetical protein
LKRQYLAAFAASLFCCGSAVPQPLPYPAGTPLALPPYEIVAIVRSTGLEPLSRPARQGPVYVLRALDAGGKEVRVLVDARMGRIVRVVPTAGQAAMPPPYGMPPGRVVPDGNGPNSRVVGVPPPYGALPYPSPPYGAPPASGSPLPDHPEGSVASPAPPGGAAAITPSSPKRVSPPLPRPRPKAVAIENEANAAPVNSPLVEE